MRKLLAALLLVLAAPAFSATDLFTGTTVALATHDSNWTTASGTDDPVSAVSIDGSGFAAVNTAFATVFAYYAAGASSNGKSEIVVPIGAFVTVNNASEFIGVTCQAGAATRGINAYISSTNITGQVINSVRVASGTSFIATQTLSPTIDTSAVALTMSIQRTSTTNANLIVNGTTYAINTTGVDLTTGLPGIILSRAFATPTTLKIDSWTDGVAGGGTFLIPTKGPKGSLGGPVGLNSSPRTPRTPEPQPDLPLMAANDNTFRLRASR